MQPVSKNTLKKMTSEYDTSIRKSSTENLKKKFPDKAQIQDAASAWVSRKELEKLLNDNDANGLRIYYGCHHESTNSDPAKDYNGLHNIILVATKDDVDPENPTFENSKDQLNEEELKPGEANTSVQNYAGARADMFPLCPPLCPK
jgi:hypothetical protein